MLVSWCHLELFISVASCFFVVLGSAATTESAVISTNSVASTTAIINDTNSTATDVSDPADLENSTALMTSPPSSPETEQCPNKDANLTLTTVNTSYGSIDTFYYIAQSICRKMQANLDEECLETLADLTITKDKEQMQKDITFFLKKELWAIILLIIGAAFIVLLPISGICFFCGRCCCNCCGAKRKHKNPSKPHLCCNLILLVIASAVIIAAMILYLESIGYTINNADNINKSVSSVSNDITEIIDTASNNVECELDKTLSMLFEQMKKIIWRLPPNVYDAFRKSSGFTIMQSVLDDLGDVRSTFSESVGSIKTTANDAKNLPAIVFKYYPELEKLKEILNDVYTEADNAEKEYNQVYDQVNSTWNNADDLIFNSNGMVNSTLKMACAVIDDAHEQTKKVTTTLNDSISNVEEMIRNGTEEINRIHEKIVTFPGHKAVVIILYLVILIPALLVVVLTAIVVFCGTIRLFSSDKFPSERPRICSCGGYLGLLAIAVAFFTGWIVMLIASISFVGGYSLETICYPLFYDPDMRLFKEVPLLQFNLTNPINGQGFTVGIGNVMEQCRERQSILSALDLESLIDVDAIMKKANIDGARQKVIDTFKKTNLTFYFPADALDKLNESSVLLEYWDQQLENITIPYISGVTQLQQLDEDLNNTKSNVSNLAHVVTRVVASVNQIAESSLKSGNFTNEGIAIFEELFNRTIVEVKDDVYKAVDYLTANSFNCRPVYDAWENMGEILCQQIGRPIQGIWAAVGLMALCFVPVIICTAMAVKYLFRMSKKYDLKKQQRIGALYGGIYAYENSPQSSTLTLVSTCSSRNSISSAWCNLIRRKSSSPGIEEPEHSSLMIRR